VTPTGDPGTRQTSQAPAPVSADGEDIPTACSTLADALATARPRSGAPTNFEFVLATGAFYAYGRIQTMTHRLGVTLHPWGIGGVRIPVGVASCSCEHWSDWSWENGRTPRLLPYPDLAVWLATHAEQSGASDIRRLMTSARGLALLAVSAPPDSAPSA
jgi:hypothetical protein